MNETLLKFYEEHKEGKIHISHSPFSKAISTNISLEDLVNITKAVIERENECYGRVLKTFLSCGIR